MDMDIDELARELKWTRSVVRDIRKTLDGLDKRLDRMWGGIASTVGDSPSRKESEKPSEQPICDAGVPGGEARKQDAAVLRKVWAVKRVSGILPGAELPLVRLFSSRDGASRYMGCNRLDPGDYTIEELAEQADGPGEAVLIQGDTMDGIINPKPGETCPTCNRKVPRNDLSVDFAEAQQAP